MRRHAHKRYLCLLWSWMAAVGLLQPSSVASQNTVELLPLEKAIERAQANNRSLSISRLEIEKSKWEASQFKTKEMPSLSATVLGSELLTPISFTFDKGVFGTFPEIGPVPATDTKITTPRRPSGFAIGQVSQPLAQLYTIRLGVHAQELNVQLSSEKARAQRQSVIRDVRQAYYAVMQSESAVEAAEAAVTQYRELDRVVLQRVSQEAALPSDSLDVKARLADQEYQLTQLRNTLKTRKESLNDLLGRDISTDFRIEHLPPVSSDEVALKQAAERTLANSPDIWQADINVRRAEYDRRIAKADYIPSVAMVLNYAKIAALNSVKAVLSQAQTALDDASLRAPFDGWVVKRSVDLGALVGPSVAGFTIADTRTVRVMFGVPENMLGRVKLGQRELIATDSIATGFAGTVTGISPEADPKSRVYSVEVRVPNQKNQLKAGMIASLEIEDEALPAKVLAVPLSAVIRDPLRPEGFNVLTVETNGDDATVMARSVDPGGEYGNMIQVLNGLKPGERVVTAGATLVKNGERVRVIQ